MQRQLDQEFSNLGVFKKTVAFRSDNRAFLSTDIQMLEHENDVSIIVSYKQSAQVRFLGLRFVHYRPILPNPYRVLYPILPKNKQERKRNAFDQTKTPFWN